MEPSFTVGVHEVSAYLASHKFGRDLKGFLIFANILAIFIPNSQVYFSKSFWSLGED